MQALLSLQKQDHQDAQNALQPGLPLAQETSETPSSDIPFVIYLLPPGPVSCLHLHLCQAPYPQLLMVLVTGSYPLGGEPLVHPPDLLLLPVLSLPR